MLLLRMLLQTGSVGQPESTTRCCCVPPAIYDTQHYSTSIYAGFHAHFVACAVSFLMHASGSHESRVQRVSRKPGTPQSRTSCMALPSSVDGATTMTAPAKASKDLSVPTNLVPVTDALTVPGGKGRAIELKAGQYFKVTNTYGEQVS